jgi:hypothetical protein
VGPSSQCEPLTEEQGEKVRETLHEEFEGFAHDDNIGCIPSLNIYITLSYPTIVQKTNIGKKKYVNPLEIPGFLHK